MQPLYFLPGETLFGTANEGVLSRGVLAKHGIADTFSDVKGPKFADCEVAECESGPGGSSGVILAYKRPDGKAPAAYYHTSGWTWTQCRDNLWIGVDGNTAAEDIQRPRGYDGYKIPLADMGEFLIPVIRRDDGTTELPRVMGWNESGEFTESIREKYRSLWEETAQVLTWLVEKSPEDEIDTSLAAKMAIRALTINYRFGMLEQRVLQIVDSENYLTILGMTIDIVKINEIALARTEDAKKKESPSPGDASMSSTPGHPDTIQDTPQVAATST